MKLKIEEPCTENWAKMTPIEKGRFCDKCEKTIVDLTSFTDQEILTFFNTKEETVCGRLTKFQLHHDFYEGAKLNYTRGNKYIAASLSLLALTPAVFANSNDINIQTPIVQDLNFQELHSESDWVQKFDVQLKLVDQNGFTIAHADVRIANTDEVFKTDSLGLVFFNVPEILKGKTIDLIIDSKDWRQGEMTLETKKLPYIKEVRVQMREQHILGIMVPYENPKK